MKVSTAAEMREIDRRAIQEFGIPGAALMENAGGEVARKVAGIVGPLTDKLVCIFTGKGNNGGDGFVAARHLTGRGARVKVFLLGAAEGVTGDARIHLDVWRNMGGDIIEINEERDWDKAKFAVAFADCLVDALLGTGFHGETGGHLAEAINIMNTGKKPVVAVDIPSGIDADTGQARGAAVRASHTVTFALSKPGLLLHPGASHAGEITVADIGMPAGLLLAEEIRQNAITAGVVKGMFPRRPPEAHKGLNGRVAIVAGSTGLTGAAALAAQAAVRTGAGLVTLGVAASLYPLLAVKLTEVMAKPLPETESGVIGLAAADSIAELTSACDVLAIGPGLGQAADTQAMVRKIVREAKCPLVIDADALNALAGYTDILQESEALAVLTPHPGEMARLTGLSVAAINGDRIAAARAAAARWGAIVVLKGAGTVVAFPDEEVYINTTGNAGLATGGTGDVLTGVIAALIAQGLSSHDAAVAGAYLQGLAGDIAAGGCPVGLAASDLFPALREAVGRVQA